MWALLNRLRGALPGKVVSVSFVRLAGMAEMNQKLKR